MASTTSNNNKLKILLFGPIENEVDAFLTKLKSLCGSKKAGPFDVAFSVGPCSGASLATLRDRANSEDDAATTTLPCPVYLQDVVGYDDDDEKAGNNNNGSTTGAADDGEATSSNGADRQPLMLAPRLYLLREASTTTAAADDETEKKPSVSGGVAAASNQQMGGIWNIVIHPKKPTLTVCVAPPRFRVDALTATSLMAAVTHVSYRGCDLLLTSEWPQGIETLLSGDGQNNTNISFDVADLALKARARYHVVPAAPSGQQHQQQVFQQSPPFAHLASTTTTTSIDHPGRLLALCHVVKGKPASKSQKFVHALGLEPLHAMSQIELQQQRPDAVAPCPYTDDSYEMQQQSSTSPGRGGGATSGAGGLSEASARRILAEERLQRGSGSTAPAQRWMGQGQRKRPRHDNDNNGQSYQVDPSIKTLFIHGLQRDVTGHLQSVAGNIVLLQAFKKFGAIRVNKPPNAPTSSFCFVHFNKHEDAAACLEELGGETTVAGVNLQINWGRGGGGGDRAGRQQQQQQKRPRFTEADARDSSSIYFKFPPRDTGKRKTGSDTNGDKNQNETPGERTAEGCGEDLRVWMERTLEDALAGDDAAEGDSDDAETTKVTAATEPALQVTLRVPAAAAGKSFGFLDFASHAAASMALATLTGSTDGGLVSSDATKHRPAAVEGEIHLYWSQRPNEPTNVNRDDLIRGASGFTFERRHFPPDGRQDCWFCLASESCEKHLIVGVHNLMYTAMPKGPTHPGHVLLVPVNHSSSGAFNDPAITEEVEQLVERLRRHAAKEYDMDLYVFERAIQTRGGYHTHINCIPVPRQLGVKMQTTMLDQASKVGIGGQLREISSDLALTSVLSGGDGDDNDNKQSGYFYAEIPFGTENKRFLWKTDGNAKRVEGRPVTVPIQFGREVLAAVIGKADLAHWKTCVVDKEKETAMATSFRESFAKYE